MAMVGPAWTAAGSGASPTSVSPVNATLTTELPPITTALPTIRTPTPTTPTPTTTLTPTATTEEILGTTVPDSTDLESSVNNSTEAVAGTADTTDAITRQSLAAALVDLDTALDADDSTDGIAANLPGNETTQTPTPRPSTADSTTEREDGPVAVDETESESDAETTANVSGGSASGPRGPLALPNAEDAAPVAVVGVGTVAAAALARQFGFTASLSWPGLHTTFEAGVERAFRFTSAFRYSRHDDSDPLEHDVRAAVHEAVVERPGLHLSGLAETTDVPLSTVRHHVRVLERERLLAGVKLRGKRRFFPMDTDDHELTAALTDEATATVLAAVARNEPASVTTLALDLDRDASTVSHHLSRLTEDGLVERERDGRQVLTRLSPRVRAALAGDEESTPDRAIQSAD